MHCSGAFLAHVPPHTHGGDLSLAFDLLNTHSKCRADVNSDMRHIHCHIDDDYFGAVTGIPVVRFFSSYERGIWAAMMDACHHQSVVFYFSNINCADFSTNQVKKTFRCRRAITNCLVTNCFLHGNSSRPYFELNDRLPATQISVVTHFHTTRR